MHVVSDMAKAVRMWRDVRGWNILELIVTIVRRFPSSSTARSMGVRM